MKATTQNIKAGVRNAHETDI